MERGKERKGKEEGKGKDRKGKERKGQERTVKEERKGKKKKENDKGKGGKKERKGGREEGKPGFLHSPITVSSQSTRLCLTSGGGMVRVGVASSTLLMLECLWCPERSASENSLPSSIFGCDSLLQPSASKNELNFCWQRHHGLVLHYLSTLWAGFGPRALSLTPLI
ncbi:Rho GTPase-activating protein gacO, partial [Ophiophagus hannah]